MSDSNQPRPYVEPKPLDSTFATTATGEILEIPLTEIGRFQLSENRREELGHLPIIPYDVLMSAAGEKGGEDEDQAGGRHMIPGSGGAVDASGWGWHQGWEYGTYMMTDGSFATGIHRHPDGDQRAEGAGPEDFT